MLRTLLVFACFLCSASIAIAAPRALTGTVEWTAVGKPSFLEIKGQGAALEGTVDDQSGQGVLTAQLASMKTGIALRDEHMHQKYLETAKFPTAQLKLTKADGAKWCGDLTLKGVTKPVCGEMKRDGDKVSATFTVNVADYPVGVPSHLGVTMADTVNVRVSATLK